MYNYWHSSATETIALAPRAPYVGAVGQFETQESKWQMANQRNLTYLNNAHRLDTGSTGVILLAKDKTVFMALADQFSAEKPVRKHLALIWGNPLDDKFEVDQKLSPHPLKAGQMCVDAREGKKSHTAFAVLERFSDWCLLACSPTTDRQHQVRVHLKYVSCAVVGDEVYGLTDWYRDGTAAEYVAVEARNLAQKPASLDHTATAAIPMAALTATQALFDIGRLVAGQTVVIHGAGGGVGSFAVQLAHAAGARVIGTGHARSRELVEGLGASRTRCRRPT